MLRRVTLFAVVVLIALTGTFAQTPAEMTLSGVLLLNVPFDRDNDDDDDDDDDAGQTPQGGNCPCNYDVAFWTEPSLETPILRTEGLTACDPASTSINTCFTCKITMWSFDTTTFLSKVVDLWDGDTRARQDALFFFATEPSPEPPSVGACFAEGSVDSDIFYATFNPSTQEDGELPVINAQFPMCLSDLTALQEAFLALCPQ